jgi:hypothetical protein
MVKALLSFNPGTLEKAQASYLGEMNFRALDFNRTEFDMINDKFGAANWIELRDSTAFEDFPIEFTGHLPFLPGACST